MRVEVPQVYNTETIAGLGDPTDVEMLREVPIASAFVRARKSGKLEVDARVRQEFEVTEQRSGWSPGRLCTTRDEERVARLVALGRALSDPNRVRMLRMMAEGRSCCALPDLGGAGG